MAASAEFTDYVNFLLPAVVGPASPVLWVDPVFPPVGHGGERLRKPLGAAAIQHAGRCWSRLATLVVDHAGQHDLLQPRRLRRLCRVRQLRRDDRVDGIGVAGPILRPENEQQVAVGQTCNKRNYNLELVTKRCNYIATTASRVTAKGVSTF